MPGVQIPQTSVPANSAIDNLLRDSQFEFLPYDADLEFGFTGSAVGLVVDVYSGLDILAENFAVPGTNRFPLYPDDFQLADSALAGDRLKVRVRNTTAGALNVFLRLQIAPGG